MSSITLPKQYHFITIGTAKSHIVSNTGNFTHCGMWVGAWFDLVGEPDEGDVCKRCLKNVQKEIAREQAFQEEESEEGS